MLRPGGFPEYTPSQQQIFDTILSTLEKTFKQYHYEHIRTPAIEPVDVLKKGGDIIDKQVYGLFGLAQGVEDVKDYALHFDLTIPLARYVLDHRNDLSFPFRRYQMQPVWRGEKTKRGRFKEFWQFDIDAIWPSSQDVGVRYDIESLMIISKAMQAVCDTLGIHINTILKVSHLAVTKAFFVHEGISEEHINKTLGLLDDYFKLDQQYFEEQISQLLPESTYKKLLNIIKTHDYTLLKGLEGYEQCDTIMTSLKTLGIQAEYDICIVRGHNYYKGMVCERFERDDIALGSLAGGGRYDRITDFLDPKQSFSGVGASLGRFVPLAIERAMDAQTVKQSDSYLFAHFDDTWDHTLGLYQKFIQAGKVCECYPIATKLGKQFEYADKKGISHLVICGSQELVANSFIIKNLTTGVQEIKYLEHSYGIIPVRNSGNGRECLLAKSVYGHRSFPKGHPNTGETLLQTAIRECQEETNLTTTLFYTHTHERTKDTTKGITLDEVFFKVSDGNLKTVTYYVAQVEGTESHQIEEISELKRIAVDQAHTLATYPETKKLAQQVAKLLK